MRHIGSYEEIENGAMVLAIGTMITGMVVFPVHGGVDWTFTHV